MRRAPALAACVLVLLGSVAHAQPSLGGTGGTTFSPDGAISVRIDLAVGGFDGEIEPVDPAHQAAADDMARQISAYWSEGFASHPLGGCLQLELDVDIDVIDQDGLRLVEVTDDYLAALSSPGRHTILWGEGSGLNPGTNPAWPEVYDPYDLNEEPGHDSTSPWQHELDGVWSSHLQDPRDFAHEVGHLMGLGDDYDDATKETAAGREGTLMGDGDLIDQALIDRMAEVMRRAGIALPECWTGTMDLDLSKDYLAEQAGLPPELCKGSWRVALSFVVADDDSITGSARAELTSGPDCTFEIPGTGSTAEFGVSGSASADAFELRFAQTAIEPPGDWVGMQAAMTTGFRVDRVSATRGEARISISTTEAGPFPVTGRARVALECSGCPGG
jgi:hypothetical protein